MREEVGKDKGERVGGGEGSDGGGREGGPKGSKSNFVFAMGKAAADGEGGKGEKVPESAKLAGTR